MQLSECPRLRRSAVAATVLAIALPFNAIAAEPTPDPPEPYLTGTAGVGGVTPDVGGATVKVVSDATFLAAPA